MPHSNVNLYCPTHASALTFLLLAESCITDLAKLTSPHSTTTLNNFTFHGKFDDGCTVYNYRTFYVTVPPHRSLTIGQTANTFDSKIAVMWGETMPFAFPGSGQGVCRDDPDTSRVTLTNTLSAPRKAWFLVGGFSSTQSGGFTMSWTVQ